MIRLKARFLLISISVLLCSAVAVNTWARPVDFQIPAQSKGRVDFWIDIFARYGKYQSVFHHREKPHIVFDVLDLSRDAERMSDVQFDKFKKTAVRQRMDQIYDALKRLQRGESPRSELERQVAQSMQQLGGGNENYQKVIKEELVRSQTGIRERYLDAVVRSGRYMALLEEIFVNEFGLPVELTRLPFVESSFDYTAYSSVGAAGIWQFMRATGRAYGLRVDNLVDERRDLVSSTRAAAKYLRDAYKRLGNWPLALTSYNHGVAGVARKVRDMGTSDLFQMIEHPTRQPFGFASQNFYPEFLAALEIYDNLEKYFPGVQREPTMRLALRKLDFSPSVRHLARHLDMSEEELFSVNYALGSRIKNGSNPVPAGYVLKVPAMYRDALASLRPEPGSRSISPAASSIYGGATYKVRPGDTLISIAKRSGTSVSKLRTLNKLKGDLLRVGQTLTISQSESQDHSDSEQTRASQSTHIGTTSYRVQSGDSLYAIARKYRTTVRELQKLNNLRGSRIKQGQVLRVPAALPREEASAAQPSSKKYRVQSGDSLWSVARRHGVSVAGLKSENNLSGNAIRPGQILRIPTR